MTDRPARTSRTRALTAIDWAFVGRRVGQATIAIAFLWSLGLFSQALRPETIFDDAILYWRATQAWVSGGDPWSVSYDSVIFGGIPPTLLVNLPLLPFGEGIARPFWAVADLAGAIAMIRYFKLPVWWLAFPPLLEAWIAGSPDPALGGLVVVGGGAIAAFTKPYMIGAMLADRRWKALAIAGALAVVSIPLLPWGRFIDEYSTRVAPAFAALSHYRSFGDIPLLIPVAVLALIVLRRTGVSLAVPSLWPHSQWHYAMLSMGAISQSTILTIGFSLPLLWAGPVSVLLLAAVEVVRPRLRARLARPAPVAPPAS